MPQEQHDQNRTAAWGAIIITAGLILILIQLCAQLYFQYLIAKGAWTGANLPYPSYSYFSYIGLSVLLIGAGLMAVTLLARPERRRKPEGEK